MPASKPAYTSAGTPTYSRAGIEHVENEVSASLLKLRLYVENTYTVGMVVLVHRGRMKVQIEITGYPGGYHTNPGVIQGFNLKTGSVIKFHWRDVQQVLGKRGPQGSIVPLED